MFDRSGRRELLKSDWFTTLSVKMVKKRQLEGRRPGQNGRIWVKPGVQPAGLACGPVWKLAETENDVAFLSGLESTRPVPNRPVPLHQRSGLLRWLAVTILQVGRRIFASCEISEQAVSRVASVQIV
jgi:hypothetical protein